MCYTGPSNAPGVEAGTIHRLGPHPARRRPQGPVDGTIRLRHGAHHGAIPPLPAVAPTATVATAVACHGRAPGRAPLTGPAPSMNPVEAAIAAVLAQRARGYEVLDPYALPVVVACRGLLADTLGQLPLVTLRGRRPLPASPPSRCARTRTSSGGSRSTA